MTGNQEARYPRIRTGDRTLPRELRPKSGEAVHRIFNKSGSFQQAEQVSMNSSDWEPPRMAVIWWLGKKKKPNYCRLNSCVFVCVHVCKCVCLCRACVHGCVRMCSHADIFIFTWGWTSLRAEVLLDFSWMWRENQVIMSQAFSQQLSAEPLQCGRCC